MIKDEAIAGRLASSRRQRARTRTCSASSPGRDFEFEPADVRSVEAGDTTPGGEAIEIEPAIEIGNIFKLGTRYSEAARRHLPRRVRQPSTRS